MWRSSCNFSKKEFLTKETYEAIVLTTMSTVQCIRYLLNSGFHFVLTRKFSSDQIEILFSSIRRLGGSNDQTNAVVVMQAIHKILATGIVSASLNANSVSSENGIDALMTPCSAPKHRSYRTEEPENEDLELRRALEPHLNKLENNSSLLETTFQSATLAVISSYLIRTIHDNIDCEFCKNLFVSEKLDTPALALLKNIDRGGYFYPTEDLLKIVGAIDSAAKVAVPYVYRHPKPLLKLKELIQTSLSKNPKMVCSNPTNDECHVNKLSSLLLIKFLRPYLSNYCHKITATLKKKKSHLRAKPLSRKVHKV